MLLAADQGRGRHLSTAARPGAPGTFRPRRDARRLAPDNAFPYRGQRAAGERIGLRVESRMGDFGPRLPVGVDGATLRRAGSQSGRLVCSGRGRSRFDRRTGRVSDRSARSRERGGGRERRGNFRQVRTERAGRIFRVDKRSLFFASTISGRPWTAATRGKISPDLTRKTWRSKSVGRTCPFPDRSRPARRHPRASYQDLRNGSAPTTV
jgi:hypothetical protein